MSQPQKFDLNDSFENWSEKYNDLVDGIILGQNFEYIKETSVGRSVSLSSGRIRDGNTVFTIPSTTLTITANSEVIVGVGKVNDVSAVRLYVLGSQPDTYFVPLYVFKADAYNIISYTDLKTQISYGVGESSQSTSTPIAFFDVHITSDTATPTGKNALSIDPIVDSGISMTVTNGSTWVIL